MESYLLSVGIKKAIWAFAKGVTAFVISAKAKPFESSFGITVDPNTFQAALGSALFSAQHFLHDWLKVRFPKATFL